MLSYPTRRDPPRTVEVGMLLCGPADGVCASAWLVELVRSGVSATLVDYDHHDRHLPVALAALTHPDGGWVLAADWPGPTAAEREMAELKAKAKDGA